MSLANQNGSKDETVYTSCLCNCGSNSHCVIKAHVRDGVITAVEPDDRYHPGVGREDEVMTEADLVRASLQRRPCTRGLVFHRYLYREDRIIYPLKRTPGTERGEGKYERISWDEALTTIANNMQRVRRDYGKYSIIMPYMPNATAARLFSFWGAGCDSWGWCSYDAARTVAHLMAGEQGWNYPGYASGSPSDMLANSRLIVIWGMDPAMGSSGPGYQFAWFLKLCRERGKRVIIFDPKYSAGAAVLADQWIPIKPGTDTAMYLALAYELFRRDSWDKAFVEKYVDALGFETWRRYVLGEDDGLPKTPEWAEKQCAVPAETIRALSDMIDRVKPAWLWSHWGTARKSRGENTVRAFATLQAMLGYWGQPGAGPAIHPGSQRPVPVQASWGESGAYHVPALYRSHYWAQAVLELDQVRSGELSEKEYMRRIGWKADPEILKEFQPKMLFWGGFGQHGTDHLATGVESGNFQVPALKRMEFIVQLQSTMTVTATYADIILPAVDWMWEELNVTRTGGYGGFQAVNCCTAPARPPGEVKSHVWIYCKLAEKLGIEPSRYFKYYTSDENWERDWEHYQSDCYQLVIDYYAARGTKVPAWEDFKRGQFINCDEIDDLPFTGWDAQMKVGKPFNTASGKIEIFSRYLADEDNRGTGEHYDHLGRMYDNLASDWGNLQPSPIYEKTVRGMDDPLARQYPLMVMSPHARYRVHYLFWEHEWLRNHVYSHRVWISTTDAARRGIRDGDRVSVYNDRGHTVLPAYVTSRLMPGLVVIRNGARYNPDAAGTDFGGAASTLMGGDDESYVAAAHATTLAEVALYWGEA